MIAARHANKHPSLSGKRRPWDSRSAAVLLVALVCVCAASALIITLVQLARTDRDASQTESWRLQAGWLVESGLERAAAALASDGGYTGQTWRIPADELGGKDGAVVKITVERPPEQPGRRRVHVRADYPDHPRHRARKSKQVIVDL